MRQLLSNLFHQQLLKFRYVKELFAFKQQYDRNCSSYPGHFYSPVIDKQVVLNRSKEIWPDQLPHSIAGININLEVQLQWAKVVEMYYADLHFPEFQSDGHRYFYNNDYYSYTDAISLSSFLRKLHPSQVIEVGSGFSSAVMLDITDQFELKTAFVFIDPYPERLNQLLHENDQKRVSVLPSRIQDIPLEYFEALNENDILFIDSSHVIKTDSDVNYYLFEIFPRLKQGVYIHIHDVFYPFQYPKEWIETGCNWSEIFAVRAFLMNNSNYQIQFFSHFLHAMHPDCFEKMPLMRRNFGGNLWLRKCVE